MAELQALRREPMRRSALRCLGLTIAVVSAWSCVEVPTQPASTEVRSRIAGLKAERLRLQQELASTLPEDARLVDAPPGGLLIGLPTPLVEEIVTEALTGPLRNVRLLLKDVATIKVEDVIKRDTFLGDMTLGRYDLTVKVEEVRALVRPLSPSLIFGSNRIAIDLPVRIEGASVQGNLAFEWDGRRLAGIVCGDLSSQHELRARVPPLQVRLRGRFDVEAEGEKVLVRPRIAPIDLAFQVEPPQETWDFIEEVIESRNAICKAALRKAAVEQKVRDLVARGFKVRLTKNWLHPMVLPASFRETFDVQGRSTGLAILPTGVSITRLRIWYGANLSVQRESDGG